MSDDVKVSDDELLKSLEVIKKYCSEQGDCNCCACSRGFEECAFVDPPADWKLNPRITYF